LRRDKINVDEETIIKYYPKECLYCGNSAISVKRKIRSSETKSTLLKIWLKIVGGSQEVKDMGEYVYMEHPAIVECHICGRVYEVVGLSDDETKNFVRNSILKNGDYAEGMKGQIIMFMKKENIKPAHIYENLIGVTIPHDRTYKKYKKKGMNVFHILFEGLKDSYYFATLSIVTGKTSFRLMNISPISERFNKSGGII